MKRPAGSRITSREYWDCPVSRKNLVVSFILSALLFAGVAWEGIKQQALIRDNQCDNINRLGETKLFMLNILERRGSGTVEELSHLRDGVRVLAENAAKLKDCGPIPTLAEHHHDRD